MSRWAVAWVALGCIAACTGEEEPTWSVGFGERLDGVVVHAESDLVVVAECFDRDLAGARLDTSDVWGVCLARLGVNGRMRWSRGFVPTQGANWAPGPSLAVDASLNSYIAGNYGGLIDFGGGQLPAESLLDAYVASFDAGGRHRWSRGLADVHASGGVAVDANGNVFLGGTFRGIVDFGGGPIGSEDVDYMFVASYGSDGAYRWARAFAGGAVSSSRELRIAVDAGGNLVVIGTVSEAIDFGGGAIDPGPADGFGLVAFVASLDPAGAHRWSRRLAVVDDPELVNESLTIRGLALGLDGSVYLAGSLNGTVDFGDGPVSSVGAQSFNSGSFAIPDTFLVRYGSDGALDWTARFGDDVDDSATAVGVDTLGNVYLAGTITPGDAPLDLGDGPIAGGPVYVASFTPGGQPRWSRRIEGGTYDASATIIALDDTGSLYLSGSPGSDGFELDGLTVDAELAGYIVKLSP